MIAVAPQRPKQAELPPRRRWVFPALVFGVWNAVGLFSAAQWWLVRATADGPVQPLRGRWLVESMWLWAAFTLLIFPLAHRFP
ncbi:MAG TPA: hypothetical protein VK358_06660, partial [Longimicrobium sp.]|nr:hypothetical protein [Longimicrobium sp.]